jgi:hypothetical protein
MGRSTDAAAQREMGLALPGLVARMEPEGAKAMGSLVLDAMDESTNPYALASLGLALPSLTGRLKPSQAKAAAHVLLAAMRKTNDRWVLTSLGLAFLALAPHLDSTGASGASIAAQLVLGGVGLSSSDSYQLLEMDDSLPILISRVEAGEAAKRAVVAAQAIGGQLSPPPRLFGLATLLQASQPLPCRFSTQELVDLLKRPTCVGRAREVVLRSLGQKCGQPFADVWEFVDWAQEHRPDLDLTTPPRRPQQ